MRMVTTHTEGRVVTHSSDDAGPIEVVQLPARDAAVHAAAETATPRPAAAKNDPPSAGKTTTGTAKTATPPKAPKTAKKRARS